MITSEQPCYQAPDHSKHHWQQCLAQSINDPALLLKALNLPDSLLDGARSASQQFPLRVTQHYLSLIEPQNPNDPLLRQILPIAEESHATPGYQTDPVGDAAASLSSGLLQKYQGRALLITTGACAIHCRYCFRRHYPYSENNALRHWDNLLKQLQQRPDIDEIILSGGDPLSLADDRLNQLIKRIESIPHIKRLRIHTRLPIVLPERITTEFINNLQQTHLSTCVVLHCNHPNELHPSLKPHLDQLRSAKITLLNQSVLLAGVNDEANTLIKLSEALFEFGILPYYLHLLDPVQGAAHFDVSQDTIQQIKQQLIAQLPGYLVPRIVREIPGEHAKTPWEAL